MVGCGTVWLGKVRYGKDFYNNQAEKENHETRYHVNAVRFTNKDGR